MNESSSLLWNYLKLSFKEKEIINISYSSCQVGIHYLIYLLCNDIMLQNVWLCYSIFTKEMLLQGLRGSHLRFQKFTVLFQCVKCLVVK